MSATLAPFGLRPAFHPSGLDRAQALANGIPSAYSSDILKGQAVKYVPAAGVIEPVDAAGDALSGAFAGVEWTDTTGRRRVSNYWPALTAYQTGSCVAYFYNDPSIVYEIQADGAVEQTALGHDANLNNFAAGSNVTGLSQATLNNVTLATTVQGQVQILDIAPYPGNNWSDGGSPEADPYPILRVQIARRQIAAVVPGI
jgi:hypothetical protein